MLTLLPRNCRHRMRSAPGVPAPRMCCTLTAKESTNVTRSCVMGREGSARRSFAVRCVFHRSNRSHSPRSAAACHGDRCFRLAAAGLDAEHAAPDRRGSASTAAGARGRADQARGRAGNSGDSLVDPGSSADARLAGSLLCRTRKSVSQFRSFTGIPAAPGRSPILRAKWAMSRSAFAARFSELVGEPMMHYLTRWRMNVALEALRQERHLGSRACRKVGLSVESRVQSRLQTCRHDIARSRPPRRGTPLPPSEAIVPFLPP